MALRSRAWAVLAILLVLAAAAFLWWLGGSDDEPELGIKAQWLFPPPVTSGAWAPAWSPDGSRIALARRGAIWSVPAAGGIAVALTHRPAYDSQPAWSPDGRSLAFARDLGEATELWLRDMRTGEERALVAGDGRRWRPAWSPDGRALVFVELVGDNGVLRIVQAETGDVRTLLDDARLNMSATWSPDGRALAFAAERRWRRGGRKGRGGLFGLRADGSGKPRLLVPETAAWNLDPAWSPDGSQLAYAALRDGRHQIQVVAGGGGEPRRLADLRWDSFSPSWSPDGSRLAFIASTARDTELWTVAADGTSAAPVPIEGWQDSAPSGTLEVVIRDDGRPTPARVTLTDAQGKAVTPQGHAHRQASNTERHYFYSTGRFSLELLAGTARVEISRGPEYAQLDRPVAIAEGRTTRLEVDLRRLADMGKRGYFSGDNHVHLRWGGRLHPTLDTMKLAAAAEDLDVVHVLAATDDTGQHFDDELFLGQPPSTRPEDWPVVSVQQEFRSRFFGHVGLLGLHQRLPTPTVGFEAAPRYSPSPASVLQWAHARSALGGFAHPFYEPMRDYDPFRPGPAGRDMPPGGAVELPVAAVSGQVDFLDIGCQWTDPLASAQIWYRLLNLGFRIAATAGTDVSLDYTAHPPVGSYRVYARVDGPPTHRAWLSAVAGGHTLVTNGPLVLLNVDGVEPGDRLFPRAGQATARVEVEVISNLPAERLELVAAGRVVHGEELSAKERQTIVWELPLPAPAWIAARVTGAGDDPRAVGGPLFAHTGPVWLGRAPGVESAADDARFFARWIELALAEARKRPGFPRDAADRELVERWQRARRFFESAGGGAASR